MTGTVYAAAGSFTGNISAATGNIGNWNITSGELANGTEIILNASDSAIYINDSTWQNQGIQLEYNSGTPRAYFGDGSTKYFEFDGTDVNVGGNITAINITADSGSIGG